jgi:peptidoglycan/LPS O-acetylase OafA/YrhL
LVTMLLHLDHEFALLVLVFQAPKLPTFGSISYNGLYDAACVLFLFPLIILSGAHSDSGAAMVRLCKFSGRLSYPLYITHIPFVYMMENYAHARHPSTPVLLGWIFVFLPFVVTVAWLFLTYFDERVRAWLTSRYSLRKAAVQS